MGIAVTIRRGLWVRNLRVDEQRRVQPVCSPELLDPARREVGADAVDWAVRLGYDVATRAVSNFPELGTGAPQLAMLRLGTESSAIIPLVAIARGDLEPPEITEDAIRSIDDFVHRGVALFTIWTAMRQGHSWLTEGFMRACVETVPLPEQPDQLQLTSQVLFSFVNRFSAAVGREYEVEHERWMMSAIAARNEMVRSLLDGTCSNTDRAEKTLHYNLSHRHHIAIVLWADTVDPASGSTLQTSASALLHAAGAEQIILIPHGANTVHGWGNRTTQFPERMTESLRPSLTAGMRASLGSSHAGIRGFTRTHEEAQSARRAAEDLAGIDEPIVDFPSVHLLTLLAQDPEKARYFVEAELGALGTDDDLLSELRRTAIAYLRHKRSPAAAAQELFVVRNTVAYRLKKVEDLLGRSLDERTLETWVALVLKESLTAPVREHAGRKLSART